MAEKTFEPNLKSENTDVTQTSSQFVEREFMKYYVIKQHVTAAQLTARLTAKPVNYFEQEFYYNDGVTYRVYYYINGAWKFSALS